jgi:hypothetical protein
MNAPGLDPRIQWHRAVTRDVDLPRSVRHVAMALVGCLNYAMTGAAPLSELMAMTGYGRQAVLRGLRALRENDWLYVTQRHSPGHATVYRAEIPSLFHSEVSPQTPVHRDEVSTQTPVKSREVSPQTPVHTREVSPQTPGTSGHPSQVSGETPLFNKTTTTRRTYGDGAGLFRVAAAVDNGAHDDVIDGVLVRFSSTRVYPVSGRSTNGLREVISQRLAAGYTAEALVTWAAGISFTVINPAGLLAKEFALERQSTPQGPARPVWCGQCKSSENRIMIDGDGDPLVDENGSAQICPECHPRSFALEMAR